MHRSRRSVGLILLTLAVVASVTASVASSSRKATTAIVPSPPFTAKELSAPAGNNWYEYYGALTGTRYSSS